jgi:ADP-heptose:LPS heptosyltransferase
VSFNPRNILVIDFGQLGDVVISLPALRAIRERFPLAQITVAVGKPAAALVEMSGSANAIIAVDRVELRDGFKPVSILKILRMIKDVRRREFDFVIDLHSFSETNLLGFLSGAPDRLFSRRPGRSLDFLANFKPRPSLDRNDPNQHLIDRYFEVLLPLGIRNPPRIPQLSVPADADRAINAILRKSKAEAGVPLVGLFPGAGHASRRWPLERFAQLAEFLIRNDHVRPIVFLGPEERNQLLEIRAVFAPSTVIVHKLSIPQLAAAQARLAVFVSNDTGPAHIAAAVGTPTVILTGRDIGRDGPHAFVPLATTQTLIFRPSLDAISVEEVYEAVRALMSAERTTKLFAS